PLETDGACRMYILNSVELNMVNRLDALAAAGVDVVRIESIGTRPDALAEQVRVYSDALARLAKGDAFDDAHWQRLAAVCPDGFTTGHFYRGPE
ncbi:MAG: U32 family peptidase, partial [Thermoplasmatota archaeon]